MKSFAGSRFGLLLSALLLVVIAGAAFPILSSEGWVFRKASLDFHHVAPWIAAGAALLVLSRMAAFACKVLEERPAPASYQSSSAEASDYEDESESEETDQPENELTGNAGSDSTMKAAAIAQGLLQGAGWAALIVGVLTAIAGIPATISARPGAPDLDSLDKYLRVFSSLIKWVIFAAAFYGLLRTVKVFWPPASDALPFPWRPFAVLAAAYLFLANGGVFNVVFNFPGGLVLAVLVLVLALSYLASAVRRVVALPLPARVVTPARVLLLLTDLGWIVVVLGIMLSLPGIADGIPELQEGGALESVAPYLEILDTLAFWSIILLSPFIVVRAVAAFRPVVGDVFGFPMGRIILFAFALIGFSGNGVASTASSFPIPQLMPAMAAALLISYLTLILRRVAQLGLPDRIAVPMINVPPLIGCLMPAITASLLVWSLLQSFPLISASLLDNGLTASFGKASLSYFAGLFEVRYALTSFVFVVVLSMFLPDPLWTPARLRVRPMVTAVGFIASACLLWLSVAPLSSLGHVFPLMGAIIGAGLLTLGLSQLTAYLADSREPLFSGPSRWLTSAKARGFLIGGAIAFYGMLLRPLMYETLWFAAVYEWIVVFAVAVWIMLKIHGSLRIFVETAEAAPLDWTRWTRHEQRFEDRPDPRRDLVSRWQWRFVESGDWTSLWSYLMGLLCRNNASPESVRAVFRPLRESVAAKSRGGFRRRGRDKDNRRREVALTASLLSAEQALSTSPGLSAAVDASTINEAAAPFIESGADPEAIAAIVISAYRLRGTDLNRAVNLWFPLVNVVDSPPRWFEPPWVRRRTRARAQERRRRLIEGAISHLSGEGTFNSLPVGVAAGRTPMVPVSPQRGQSEPAPAPQPDPMETGVQGEPPTGTVTNGQESTPAPSRFMQHQMMRAASQTTTHGVSVAPRADSMAQGQGFELLSETNASYLIRTLENSVGYVSKSALKRLPILPGDEVNVV